MVGRQGRSPRKIIARRARYLVVLRQEVELSPFDRRPHRERSLLHGEVVPVGGTKKAFGRDVRNGRLLGTPRWIENAASLPRGRNPLVE